MKPLLMPSIMGFQSRGVETNLIAFVLISIRPTGFRYSLLAPAIHFEAAFIRPRYIMLTLKLKFFFFFFFPGCFFLEVALVLEVTEISLNLTGDL